MNKNWSRFGVIVFRVKLSRIVAFLDGMGLDIIVKGREHRHNTIGI